MALKKTVLLDGKPYGWHVVQEAVTNWDSGFTRVNVMSWTDEAARDTEPPRVGSIDVGLLDGVTEQAAYAIVDSQWPEYVDQRDETIEEQAAIIADISDILTDEQAETMPSIYPEWTPETEYAVGKRVRYDDKLYRCVQAHTSQEGWEPPVTPALWTRTAAEGEIPEWVQPTGAHDAYAKGDKVTHDGKTWESTYDGANVWEPGVYGWDEVTE